MGSDGDVTRMPSRFDDGVALFNDGRFFEAHEAFEDLLDEVEEDGRWDLLIALIQVAVGYHKLASSHAGSARMLGLGLRFRPHVVDRRRHLRVTQRIADSRSACSNWYPASVNAAKNAPQRTPPKPGSFGV